MDTAAGGTFTYSNSVNRGYAIPIDKARAVADQIVAGHGTTTIHIGEHRLPRLHARARAPTTRSPRLYGLTVDAVVPGSPIDRVGIVPGDVLTRFDGKAVNTVARLTALVVTKHPGDAVQVRWVDEYGTGHTASAAPRLRPAPVARRRERELAMFSFSRYGQYTQEEPAFRPAVRC